MAIIRIKKECDEDRYFTTDKIVSKNIVIGSRSAVRHLRGAVVSVSSDVFAIYVRSDCAIRRGARRLAWRETCRAVSSVAPWRGRPCAAAMMLVVDRKPFGICDDCVISSYIQAVSS